MTFNQEKYLQLFLEIVIKPIESDEELDRYVKLVEPYFFDKEKTAEETAIYELLCLVITDYESKHYPIPEVAPLDLLLHLMEAGHLKEENLVSIIGSENITRLVLNGACEIDRLMAKALGNFFKINYKNFL